MKVQLSRSSSSVDGDELIAVNVSSYSVDHFSKFCKILNDFMNKLMQNV